MPPLPADSIHARACKLKCEKILTRPKCKGQKQKFSKRYLTHLDQGGKNKFGLWPSWSWLLFVDLLTNRDGACSYCDFCRKVL